MTNECLKTVIQKLVANCESQFLIGSFCCFGLL